MSTCFLSVVITSEQVVHSAVVQCIIKFITNKNVKPAEILMSQSTYSLGIKCSPQRRCYD